ncbi:hypothetical protein D0X99_17140 [Algoriphagus lacus]|uniref:STAS/SEC14 domain-containing protein n=1 Tax=Algoriphagus lacus TaxID=2056311 RepID=A0A418PNA0_9BACT|nr:hypothetical protein [Algoriphagus lacus]RIW13137.1 hypothetical protein D0X99_17140 [Algoriphagus lacus]
MTEEKFSIKIFRESGYMAAKFYGKVVLSDMLHFTQTIISMPDYSPGYPLIFDFRDCKAIGYRIDVPEFLKYYQSKVTIPEKKKYGFIYSTLNQKFIFSILKLSAPKLNLEIELFDGLKSCLDWMDSDPQVASEIEIFFKSVRMYES